MNPREPSLFTCECEEDVHPGSGLLHWSLTHCHYVENLRVLALLGRLVPSSPRRVGHVLDLELGIHSAAGVVVGLVVVD